METKLTKAMKIASLLIAGGAIVAALTGRPQHWWTFAAFAGAWLFLKLIEANTEEKERDYYE